VRNCEASQNVLQEESRRLGRSSWKPRSPTPAPAPSVLDLATSLNLTQFTEALARFDGLSEALDECPGYWSNDGKFTVFAPTDDAFTAVDPSDLNLKTLLTDDDWSDHLKSLLTYHIVKRWKSYDTNRLNSTDSIRTLEGSRINVTSPLPSITINDATIVTADQIGCNGVLHAIDSVLLPPSATNDVVDALDSEETSVFLNYTTNFGLNSILKGPGPFTLFVPSDEAFENADMESQLPSEQEDVIKYHISQNFGLTNKIKDLNEGESIGVETLQGTNFTISTSVRPKSKSYSGRQLRDGDIDEKFSFNGDNIRIKRVILAKNGVIFVINKLILLESVFPMPSAAPTISLAPTTTCANTESDSWCESKKWKCNKYWVSSKCKKTCNACA
jgi:uncharacterized surface protein with fasciclin (FAS1) repeats